MEKSRSIAILGSTGSIGKQTLEVAEKLGLRVCALTANRNVRLLEEQARKFKPELVVATDEKAAADLMIKLRDTNTRVLTGKSGLVEAAVSEEADTVVTAVVGVAGLMPTIAAIESKKRIALANKETLVCAGNHVMAKARETGAEIIPVDSEHSAVFQCLQERAGNPLKTLILTASGGPFRGMNEEQLRNVTPQLALKNPNWDMGAKVTVDSATMMNKGLEVIEAMHLFGISPDRIRVLIHPQSIVHSMVEFTDNSTMAQLAVPDMRLPIQYALTYPQRVPSLADRLDLAAVSALTFENPDLRSFKCLDIALKTAQCGEIACAVMNAANEEAVRLFLAGRIGFYGIYELILNALETIGMVKNPSLDEILAADAEARRIVNQ